MFGSIGHNRTVDYIYNALAPYSDYFNITRQSFQALFSSGSASFTVDGVDQGATLMTYSTSTDGNLTATIVPVANLGCNAVSELSSPP